MSGNPYPVPPEPTVMGVALAVIGALESVGLREALDAYLTPGEAGDNVRCRFLSRKRAYEVVVYLDAAKLSGRGLDERRA